MRPGPARLYPRPKALFVTIKSNDGQVDLQVTILRGGKLDLSLADGPDYMTEPLQINLPDGLRDQKHWVCGPGGMVPGPVT